MWAQKGLTIKTLSVNRYDKIREISLPTPGSNIQQGEALSVNSYCEI
jgi:hypothetical protein